MNRIVVGAVVVIVVATALAVMWSRSSVVLEPSAPSDVPRVEVTAAPPPVPRPPEAQPVVPAPAPVAVAAPPSPEPAPVRYEDLIATATKQATENLERLRPSLVQRCWVESHASDSGGTAGVDLEVTFDAQGNEIARGGSEHRGSVPGVANCLRETEAGSLRIPPPGRNVTVTLKLAVQ